MNLGFLPVMRRQCATCIYRPSWQGTPIAVLEDQVREKHRGATGFKGSRICHTHPKGVKATCRGFWNRHKDEFAVGQVAQRLGLVQFVEADKCKTP